MASINNDNPTPSPSPVPIYKTKKIERHRRYAQIYKSGFNFIGISGIIGVGKTTLTNILHRTMGYSIALEPVETNPYLKDFYIDMKRWAFEMQIFLLNERYRQHQQIIHNRRNTVQDRTIYEDPIFAKMLYDSGIMPERSFETYCNSFQNMMNNLHRPDLIIYLDVEPEKALERIKARVVSEGRTCEAGLPLQYLKDLKAGYEDWLENDVKGKIPVLKVDWNSFKTPEEIVTMVSKFLDENNIGDSLIKM